MIYGVSFVYSGELLDRMKHMLDKGYMFKVYLQIRNNRKSPSNSILAPLNEIKADLKNPT